MNILVTGAAGMLGSALVPEFRKLGHEVFATDIVAGLPRLDVRDEHRVNAAVAVFQPDLIFHLAAETSLEVCDGDPDYAWATNTTAVDHYSAKAPDPRWRV